MKAFLQNENGLYFTESSSLWVEQPAHARAFSSVQEAEAFRADQNLRGAHTVTRLDPSLIQRFLSRAPGRYQAGE